MEGTGFSLKDPEEMGVVEGFGVGLGLGLGWR